MEKFIELIRDMHAECYDTILGKIIAQKIPVAIVAVVNLDNAFAAAKKATLLSAAIGSATSPTVPINFTTR